MTSMLKEGSLWRAKRSHWLQGDIGGSYQNFIVNEDDIVLIVSSIKVVDSLQKWNLKFILGEKIYDVPDVNIELWHSYYQEAK